MRNYCTDLYEHAGTFGQMQVRIFTFKYKNQHTNTQVLDGVVHIASHV